MKATARKLPCVQTSPQSARKWVFRDWGKLSDPIHKSNMSSLVGEFSCTEQFKRDRQRELNGFDRETCSGRTEMGTAVHETIARALRNVAMVQSLLRGHVPTSREAIRKIIADEFARATAGRTVSWYGKGDYEAELDAGSHMVIGLFADLHNHVRQVELVEAGFIVQLGELFLEGHTDLVYRPVGANFDALAFTDWKTSISKPHQIELDHGYESGFYAHALAEGIFLPTTVLDVWRDRARDVVDEGADAATRGAREFDPLPLPDLVALGHARDDRSAMHVGLRALMRLRLAGEPLPPGVRTFDQFPEVIRRTHLRDYVPYTKSGAKAVERPEDRALWERVLGRPIAAKEKIKYVAGQQRGGAWLTVSRRADDVQRLETVLRSIVGWVRFGRFVPAVGEKCTRCSYRVECLTGGFELGRDAQRVMNADLRELDLGATDELDSE